MESRGQKRVTQYRPEIVRPAAEHLDSFRAALHRGWSPETMRSEEAIREHLDALNRDPSSYLAALDDPEGRGPDIWLPDGRRVPRLPSKTRWIWDGAFAGLIGFRWQHGTSDLPDHVPGHIGFTVVPWKQGRGYATEALAFMLEEARRLGLPHVDLVTETDNIASHAVIRRSGGRADVETQAANGCMRWRIAL